MKKKKTLISISSTQNAMRVPRAKIKKLIPFIARLEGVCFAEVDIAVVGAEEIETLNRRHLNHTGPTDVLSFDLSAAGDFTPTANGLAAQIIVCGKIAREQGIIRQTGPQRELMLYITHGLLHLLGYDDSAPRLAAKMSARQDEILDEFLNSQ